MCLCFLSVWIGFLSAPLFRVFYSCSLDLSRFCLAAQLELLKLNLGLASPWTVPLTRGKLLLQVRLSYHFKKTGRVRNREVNTLLAFMAA